MSSPIAVPLYNPGPMMTLAALAANGAVQRPAGETVQQQTERILAGITTQLADTSLATGGAWNAVWLGLTPDRANLAFIAQNTAQNSLAICIRGTLFSSLIDLGEDLDVGSLAQFTAAQTNTDQDPILVSLGAMKAFTEITNCVYDGDSTANLYNTTLGSALATLLTQASPNPTLYVVGHSLGGAIATMVGLYLTTQTLPNQPLIAVYTFAAPTAGLQTFANYYDNALTLSSTNQSWRVYNVWDAIPNAWQTLSTVAGFYPSPTGPVADSTVEYLLKHQIEPMPGSNQYIQPNQNGVGVFQLNTATYGQTGSFYDQDYTDSTTDDFFGQVGYQHNCYLELLQVAPLPGVAPTVTSITPNSGVVTGGAQIEIAGTGFVNDTEYTFVDFGNTSATYQYNSDISITATAPATVGTVDVRVTTRYGTSAVTTLDQYTTPAPAAIAPFVIAVDPASGPKSGGTAITITGGGFTPDCTVTIGHAAATEVVILSLTEITAVTPAGKGAVDVVVTNASGSSTQSVQFKYSLL